LAKFKALDPITCDGKDYAPGDILEPRPELVPQLLEAGAIEPIKDSPKVETGKLERVPGGSKSPPPKRTSSRKSTKTTT
jgi:hypothetical protein